MKLNKRILWVLIICLVMPSCTKDQAQSTIEQDIEYVDPRYSNPHYDDPQYLHSVKFRIANTGQNSSFSPKDDGWYNVNSPNLPNMSFTNNANKTITDNNTSLMWTRCSMGISNKIDDSDNCTDTHDKYKWTDAVSACETLTYDDYSDWRLPTYPELFSILEFGNFGSGQAAIDEDYFPNTEFTDLYFISNGWNTSTTIFYQALGGIKNKYWTSTLLATVEYAHFISFDDGFSNAEEVGIANYVRCVRSK